MASMKAEGMRIENDSDYGVGQETLEHCIGVVACAISQEKPSVSATPFYSFVPASSPKLPTSRRATTLHSPPLSRDVTAPPLLLFPRLLISFL